MNFHLISQELFALDTEKHPVVYLPSFTLQQLLQLIQFVYFGTVSVPSAESQGFKYVLQSLKILFEDLVQVEEPEDEPDSASQEGEEPAAFGYEVFAFNNVSVLENELLEEGNATNVSPSVPKRKSVPANFKQRAGGSKPKPVKPCTHCNKKVKNQNIHERKCSKKLGNVPQQPNPELQCHVCKKFLCNKSYHLQHTLKCINKVSTESLIELEY